MFFQQTHESEAEWQEAAENMEASTSAKGKTVHCFTL